MKAISIRQPWAHAILYLGKRIENRTWPTNYRGPILIHSSKGLLQREYYDFQHWYFANFETDQKLPPFDDLARGGIVGRAKIVDCISASTDPWFMGKYGFVLADVEPLPFVPWKGALGLFDVSTKEHGEAMARENDKFSGMSMGCEVQA